MILSPRHITSSPLVLITAVVFAVIFILGAISRPSWPSSLPFSTSHSSDQNVRPSRPKHDTSNTVKPDKTPYISPGSEKTNTRPKPDHRPLKAPDTTPHEPSHPVPKPAPPPPEHPIDGLIHQADQSHKLLLKQQIDGSDVKRAADVYRKRRNRHPPPGFDKWLEYAQKQDSLIVEDMFDQIYTDLEPFWSLKPSVMRQQAIDWPFSISIRGGEARKREKRLVSGEWLDYWQTMFQTISQYLPDVDIALNQIDESRIVVPREDMDNHMQIAMRSRTIEKPASKGEVVQTYPDREVLSFEKDDIAMTGLVEKDKGLWESKTKFWEIAKRACPPTNQARTIEQDGDLSKPAEFEQIFPSESESGYVFNWTKARDVCQHPELFNLHGSLVNPRFTSVNTTLFPLFSGCKIQGINNEILLPAAKYFSDEEEFASTGTHVPWESKKGGLIWRGQATGGAHKANNWKRFHRHRFVAMLNGTAVSTEENSTHSTSSSTAAESAQPKHFQEIKGAFAGLIPPPPARKAAHNIPLPSASSNPYNLSALLTSPSTLGKWLAHKTNVGFDHLMCDPWKWSILGDGHDCSYLNPYYHAVERVPMTEEFGYKYLPDVDGNSYSGRYRAFLRSGSLPIKATIWSEWHDSRLIAWKHFVPVHSSYVDLWGVLEYFWGYGTGEGGVGSGHGMDFVKGGFREGESEHPELRKKGHDAVARRIAEDGQKWAEKVLRREDMLVYVYRLVLEYARVVSDEREAMGWVEDLFE